MENGQHERRQEQPRKDSTRPAAPCAARQETATAPTQERPTTAGARPTACAAETTSPARRKRAHYQRIGAMGGTKVRDRHGPAYYRKIGQRGGEVTSRTMSQEHFREIGQLGGRISALRRRAKRWRDDQEEWRDLDTLASRDDWQDWFE